MAKILAPHNTLIEETAAQIAGAFYETGRSQGGTSIHKNAREYAKANFEKFIPKAIEQLMKILNGNYPEEMKRPIYDALLERANDKELDAVFPRVSEPPKKPDGPITVLHNLTRKDFH